MARDHDIQRRPRQGVRSPAAVLTAVLATCSWAGQGAAQEQVDPGQGIYRIVQGDEVTVSYTGAPEPVTLGVDVDGQIRLDGVGGVGISGYTLDEAEARIEAALTKADLFVDPSANLRLVDYAPVAIVGDVTAPGRYDYIPGMTVSAGLGLAGGSQRTGLSQYEIERARIDVEGELDVLNLQIAETAMRIARLEAIASDAEAIAPPEALLSRIPERGAVDMDYLLEAEREIFRTDLTRKEDLLAFWNQEIESIEVQRGLFEDRIAQQERILQNAADNLEVSRDLEERGLQTNARMRDAEQRDADAQSRMIEMQSALVRASQSISDAERARTQFLANRRENALLGSRNERASLDSALSRYRSALERRSILSGGMVSLSNADLLTVTFDLSSPRPDRPGDMTIRPETPLLPGDTLIVTISAGGTQDG